MSYIRWFHEIGSGDLDQVGGKGANLGELTSAQLPVPPGFCLTAIAYQDFLQAANLTGPIQEILAGTRMDDPSGLEENAAAIRQLITDQQVPDSVAGQVLESYRRLGEQMAASDATQAPVAVRSSATAEDLPEASFAGQQDTYLNVRGDAQLLDSVKKCWASLWNAEAIAYRTEQGFDHGLVYLAVVVQAMVDSEVAGVMFQANPNTGSRREALIEASWGLGEAVVSGVVTPDTITVRKRDGEILSHQIGPKEHTISYASDGGIVRRETPPESREAPVLSAQEVADLMAIGQQVESHYGAPQDTEWAYANGRFYMLQARPITTLTLQEESFPPGTYNRSMFVEIFPDPLSPVFLSVIQPMFDAMLDFTFRALGFTPSEDHEPTGVFFSQPYFKQDYIQATLAPLSPSVRERLVAQIVNPFGRHEQNMQGELSLAYLGMVLRLLRFMVRLPKWMPSLVAQYQQALAEVEALDLDRLSEAEIVARANEFLFGPASRLLNYNFLLIAVTGITYQALGSLLERYFHQETEEIRSKLVSGVTGNVTMETNIKLWDLAQVAKGSQSASEMIRGSRGPEVLERLGETPEGRDFLNSLEEFLRSYGHREIRMDILYPSWGEDPAPVLSFIRTYLDASDSQSPHAQQARLVQQREELAMEVKRRVAKDLRGRLVIWPIFRWVLNHTQTLTRERDTMHFELTRLFPPMRRLFLDLGRRWSAQGLIEEPEDIFFIGLDEYGQLAESPHPMMEEVQLRKQAFEAHGSRSWPNIIEDGEEIYPLHAAPETEDENQLAGLGGSAGRVTGVAKVIQGPEEFDKLKNGEILVAPLTNPVWTPLFAIAGGVVTEVGGMLSHGAIVAREYGIPAVLSAAGATGRIRDGQTITVDGNKGVVLLTAKA